MNTPSKSLTRIGLEIFGQNSSVKPGSRERNRNKMIESSHRNVKISDPGQNNLDRHMAGYMKPPDLELIQRIKRALYMSPFPLVPRGPRGQLMLPSC